MAFFIIIAVIYIIYKIATAGGSSDETTPQPSQPRRPVPPSQPRQPAPKPEDDDKFHARILIETITDNDSSKSEEIFKIQVRGPISVPYDNFPAVVNVLMSEQSEGDNDDFKPVLCNDSDFDVKEYPILIRPKEDYPVPYRESRINDWTTLFSVMTSNLVFPRRGRRNFQMILSFNNGRDFPDENNCLAIASYDFTYNVTRIGYDERDETRKIFEYRVLTIAKKEAQRFEKQDDAAIKELVANWIKTRSSIYPDENMSEMEQRMKRYYADPRISQKDNNELCADMKRNAETHELYSAMDLFLDIAELCGNNFTLQDIPWIDQIATKLELDKTIYNEQKHKKLKTMIGHQDTIAGGQTDIEKLLGIEPTWSMEEKKKHLNSLFKIWNPIMTHRDPAKREQAENMIKLIASYRQKLV